MARFHFGWLRRWPPATPPCAALDFLSALGQEIATQDRAGDGSTTHATAYPVYMVQQLVRIWGIDPDHTDPDGWETPDSFQADPIPYIERWELVQGAVALTRKGIDAYLRLNGHNLNQPRIYVASLSRCKETIALRQALIDLGGRHP